MSEQLLNKLDALTDQFQAWRNGANDKNQSCPEIVYAFVDELAPVDVQLLGPCAVALSQDPSPIKREAGCWLLSMAMFLNCWDKQPTLDALEARLGDEDANVLEAAIHGLRNNDAAMPLLLEHLGLAKHVAPNVRLAVANAIGGVQPPPEVIKTLIMLSHDEDADVRDWATFGLGDICEVDAPEIREALIERLSDSHYDTQCEAILGLARRGDLRVLPPLTEALQGQSVGRLTVEAAGELAHPNLLPLLEELTTWWDVDIDLLNNATAACLSAAKKNATL